MSVTILLEPSWQVRLSIIECYAQPIEIIDNTIALSFACKSWSLKSVAVILPSTWALHRQQERALI